MIKLCLGTYLSVLKKFKAASCTQKHLVYNVLNPFDKYFGEDDDAMISNLVNGRKNVSESIRENASAYNKRKNSELIKTYKENVIVLLDPNSLEKIRLSLCKIIYSDKGIKEDCVINPISGVKKIDIYEKKDSISKFLAGLLLYILVNTDNKNQEKSVNALNDRFYKKACLNNTDKNNKIQDSTIKKNSDIERDETVYREAQNFIIEHEKELGLLPLCQIALYVNPLHKYVRELYTDFCKCSKAAQTMILELNNQIKFDFSDKHWVGRCIELYDKKIHESKLCTTEFLYEGAKYLHRAFLNYYDYNVKLDVFVFKPLIVYKSNPILKNHPISLEEYVYEYLELKRIKSRRRINPPFDDLWDSVRGLSTSESTVTYWVCKMIISSCYQISEYPKVYNPMDYDELDIKNVNLGDATALIETQEDMYLYALLELYKYFYSKQ